MTGYGRGTANNAEYNIIIDLKAVNHRYLELYFKLPKAYSFLEDKLRQEIINHISRGKLEVIVSIERFATENVSVKLDQTLVSSYINAVRELQNKFQIPGELNLETLLKIPELFKIIQPEEDQDQLKQMIGQALQEALSGLIKMRQLEGESLSRDLQTKLNLLAQHQQLLTNYTKEVVTHYQEKLTKRIEELNVGIPIDQNRLATEVAILADRADISEELVRVASHLEQFRESLKIENSIGRRLDFLTQELNREINTVGSKANDLKIAQIVIDFKSELEKIREQIQNLE